MGAFPILIPRAGNKIASICSTTLLRTGVFTTVSSISEANLMSSTLFNAIPDIKINWARLGIVAWVNR